MIQHTKIMSWTYKNVHMPTTRLSSSTSNHLMIGGSEEYFLENCLDPLSCRSVHMSSKSWHCSGVVCVHTEINELNVKFKDLSQSYYNNHIFIVIIFTQLYQVLSVKL